MNNSIHSRRRFLKYSAAVAFAGVAVGRALESDAADSPAGLTLGLQSYTLRSMSFDKMLEAMSKDLDLHQVELFPQHLIGLSPGQSLEKLKSAGVKAVSYGVIGFNKNDDDNRKKFEFAKSMGMTNLSCDPDPDAFDSLDKLTEEYKITASIHDHGPGHRWGKIDVIEKAIKDHSKLIGLCNDTGHFIRAGEDPLRACEVFKDRMPAMHLKDFKKDEKGNYEDCVLGDGSFPVEKMAKWLLDNKYAGSLFIEYEGGDPVNATKKSLDRLKAAAAKA